MIRISRWICAGVVSLTAMGLAVQPLAQQQDPSYVPSHRFVPEKEMAGLCTRMVSPTAPPAASGNKTYTVVVRARVLQNGSVVPLYAMSGPPGSRDAAMNAVRLWMYKPYVLSQTPIEVTTDISVIFEPGRPGGMISHPGR